MQSTFKFWISCLSSSYVVSLGSATNPSYFCCVYPLYSKLFVPLNLSNADSDTTSGANVLTETAKNAMFHQSTQLLA